MWPIASAADSWSAWPSSPASLSKVSNARSSASSPSARTGASADVQVGREVDARQQHVQAVGPAGVGQPLGGEELGRSGRDVRVTCEAARRHLRASGAASRGP